jgi:hypothetical protein
LVERFVSSRSNTTLISHFDCPGGGQVWVEGTTLFIGHMRWPSGTTIVDVADPRQPRKLATIDLPQGWHSHKVRVANGIMVVNHERLGEGGPAEFGGGIAIYDVSRPGTPKLITKWRTGGRGVHRYDFDGRYAYLSPTAEGYVGNIMMILDLADAARPVEVGRWWIPGQWKAGGEPYPWNNGPAPRCHHPLRMGNRLYVSYWHHGLFILDISDMARPKTVAHTNTSPAFAHPTHTCLPIPQPRGRRQAAAGVTLLRLDLRHHPRATAGADRDIPGGGARRRRQPATADERLPSAIGTFPRHRDPVRVVSTRAAPRRHRGPVRSAGGRPFPAASGGRRGAPFLQ